MLGLMQDRPLLISSFIEYAARFHGKTEVVTRTIEGPIHRYGYADCHGRSKRLAKALLAMGVKLGDRIGTMGWNTYRHLEAWYGISGIGAIAHTINPRLFGEQIAYIINHAEDSYIFTDTTFVPILEAIQGELKSVKGYVVLCGDEQLPETSLENVRSYEALIADHDDDFVWPEFDERTACGMCYTSGTTGNPKGVLYSHRSNVIHTFIAMSGDSLGISCKETVLPVVPMFHANGWGIPYAAAASGAKLVLPGMGMDGASLFELLDGEKVTVTAAVPTVWLMLLRYLEETGKTLDHLDAVCIGGSAAPRSMIEIFQDKYDVRVTHAWGMTETSPIGTIGTLKPAIKLMPADRRLDVACKQGRGIYGLELKVTDDDGDELPWDGASAGHLMVRGPWVARAYYRNEGGDILDSDGWFDTGDIVNIDAEGYMQITDRAKDVIKSGGEWISSIDLENVAVGHPGVAEAAVIGAFHPKWHERPLLIVVRAPGATVTGDEILSYMKGKVAKWWLPDDVVFVDELPHTATGKILKMKLRDDFRDYVLPSAKAAG
ncbi:MAG: 3-(methylthio)propionyl-CoA ligase [Sphingomonadales bacterium]